MLMGLLCYAVPVGWPSSTQVAEFYLWLGSLIVLRGRVQPYLNEHLPCSRIISILWEDQGETAQK